MKVDLVIATYNRAEQLRETLANVRQFAVGLNTIYVVNNNSTDHTKQVLREIADHNTVVINNDRNLGAAGGKNVGLRNSTADVIIVIDDDALFCSDDPVGRVRELFGGDERLGVAQFSIINFQTRRILKYEFPGDDPERMGKETFEVGYFIGAGHALRKSMLEEVGYYPDDFGLYAHEEIDLSYRAVNAGYTMRYTPSVAVLHKKDPGGRLAPAQVSHHLFYNRLIMTRKYLPFPYSTINNFLWFSKTVIDARTPAVAFRAYRAYLRQKPFIERRLLSRRAIRYMRVNRGRLFR